MSEQVSKETKNVFDENENKAKRNQLSLGTILEERYLIQDVIGIGGMGSVYRARDLHFSSVIKLVAVKEMIIQTPDPIVRQTIVKNFEREANILVTLSHAAIPKIYDYFSINDRSYLVLEYIQGKDMEASLKDIEGYFPEDQLITWAIELTDVLIYLHNHQPEPIIFRDMKPSNIMINQQNHIVLVDFGIAKIFRQGQKGTMIGTEGYSPPEQYRGEATPQADIYSLGATLHHLITKKDPRLETPFTFKERKIRDINPTISSDFDNVIDTALSYNAKDRFSTASEMKDALLVIAKKTGALVSTSLKSDILKMGQTVSPYWTFNCEDEIRSTPVCESDKVYIGSYDNNVYSLNIDNGSLIWKFPAQGSIACEPCVYRNQLIFGSKDKNLYFIQLKNGEKLLTYGTNDSIYSSPIIYGDQVIFGCDDGKLRSLSILNKTEYWALDLGYPIRSSPNVEEKLIYIGCDSGEFLCLDHMGEIKWRFRCKRAITSKPIIDNGIVYFTSHDGILYALDAKSGWSIWRFRMEKGSASSPMILGNNIYFGSADGNIYCLNLSTTKEVWHYKTEFQVSSSPIIYNDFLYCGSTDGNIYCLDSNNGKLIWKYHTGGSIIGSPTIANDILLVGSTDHILYAFNI